MAFLNYVLARLKEPSTYAALVPAVAAIGWQVDGATLAALGGGLVALLGVVLPESK